MEPMNQWPLNRRTLLRKSLQAGAGLTLSVMLPSCALNGSPQGDRTQAAAVEYEANAFVKIGTDNRITVVIKHLEMGQGTYTGLATLVAEEMDADWNQIQSESAPADTGRYKNLHWGAQGTGGSSAIANAYLQMREAGAAARQMLVAAAATQWQVPAAEIEVQKGVVEHRPSGRTATFGELAELAAGQPVPEKVALKAPADFKLIGSTLPRKDTGKTNGKAIFTQDIQLPGMLTAVVAHPPRFGAKLTAVDAEAAKKLPGVVDVVRLPNAVAVLARDFWQARQGRDRLQLQWDESAAFRQSSAEVMARYRELAKKPGAPVRREGDVEAAFAQAAQVFEAACEFPFLAHATMEPMNCVVQIKENGAELWNGCQMQTTDQMVVAKALGLEPHQVKINTLLAGGSFGRRANPHSDYVLEAVSIAKAYGKPVPVKLVWTREDDTQAGYFRPMYFHHLKAGLDKQGRIIAWQHRIVGQSIIAGTPFQGMMKDGIDPTSVEGAANLPYSIPNLAVDLHTVELPVPVQWWRSVGSTHTAFSTETFIDELAHATGQDPVTLRMTLLKDHPRHREVLRLAAEKGGWGTPLKQGRVRGVAVHESFNTYVAQVVELALDGSDYKVEKVTCAVDCGVAVNPDVIRAQMEGGIGYGLSPALFSEITFEGGKVVQSNFHDYQVLRIDNMPEVDVHIVPSTQPPTGVGEPGTPVIAPAVANALFAARGKPVRRMPFGLRVG